MANNQNLILFLLSTSAQFWEAYPALSLGLSGLFGAYAFFYGLKSILFPLMLFWLPFFFHLFKKNIYKSLVISHFTFYFALFFFCYFTYCLPHLPENGIEGMAKIKILNLSLKNNPFGKNWVYQCRLEQFLSHETQPIANQIDCMISIPCKKEQLRPTANQSYYASGILKQTPKKSYYFKMNKYSEWIPIKGTQSLAEWRFHAKDKLKRLIRSQMFHEKSALFLEGLATGEFEDKLMQMEFSRFGLQHIMAISGFHFSLIAAILFFLLRLVFPLKHSAFIVWVLLSIYFVFLGMSASILRAWCMISIALLGYFLEKNNLGLNALGVALILVVLIDPNLTTGIGFQFSFLTTAAILIGFRPIDKLLQQILPLRVLSQLVIMDKMNQHGYLLLSFFRQGLALTFAVNVVAIPLMLYHFHQFPWMSLFYNLFFPFFVSFSLFFLILGFLFTFLFIPLGKLIHIMNSYYTFWVLNLTYTMPKKIDVYFYIDEMPAWGIVVYLTIAFAGAIITHQLSQDDHERLVDNRM